MQTMINCVSEIQGEWCRPATPSMKAYNEPQRNIFIQLQDEPIPSDSEEELSELPLIGVIPPPDDTPLLSVDSRYLHYFVDELPTLLSVDYLYPNLFGRILGMTIGHPALWHSILALSSF